MTKPSLPKRLRVTVVVASAGVLSGGCGPSASSADAGLDNPCPAHCGPISDRDGNFVRQPDGGLACFC